jgi:hypothetical protein
MTEQNNSNSKNLENCKELKMVFAEGDFFIECNGKLYKLINDTLAEIITTNSRDKKQ